MRILFLTDHHLDYTSDPLYVGLSRVLGEEFIVDYPYKASFHEPERVPWYLVPRPGQLRSRQEVLDLLRDRYFDLVCVASFRRECLDECADLYGCVPFPPMVFVDGADETDIRHDVVGRYPVSIYFKREYPWKQGSRWRDLRGVAYTFGGNRELFRRTVPLPMSIVVEAFPDVATVQKDTDVSYTGRASHPRRVRAMRILSGIEGIRFSGNLYASPGDRQYKLGAGRLERLAIKIFKNKAATEADSLKKRAPNDYYREIAASRIAVCLRGGGWLTPRYFEIPALGTLLLSERPEILIPNDFEDRQHAVFFNNNLDNLKGLVQRYLRDDKEREKIAREGHAHLLKYHTCERRAEYFLNMCARTI